MWQGRSESRERRACHRKGSEPHARALGQSVVGPLARLAEEAHRALTASRSCRGSWGLTQVWILKLLYSRAECQGTAGLAEGQSDWALQDWGCPAVQASVCNLQV